MSIRRPPFDEMDRAFETMRRSMENMMAGAGDAASRWNADGGDFRTEETEDGFVLLADVPGFGKDEIEITVEGRTLSVVAERETSDMDEERATSTRRRRSVRRTVSLPDSVDVDEITATYRNGVLEIRLPAERDGDDGATHVQIE